MERSLIKKIKAGSDGYLFVAIPFIFLLIFNLLPMIMGFVMSFTSWNGINEPEFVGMENFVNVLTDDPVFYNALFNTIQFAILYVLGIGAIGLIIALAINRITRLKSFFRVTYFIPFITPLVVVSLIWILIYTDNGLINSFLDVIGVDSVGWLSNPDIALYSIIFMSIWQSMGFSMIILLAGLQNIPQQLYEAVEIDGANMFQSFLHVTLPGLKDTFVFIVIYGLIIGFQVFDQIFVMTSGGPVNSTQTLVYMVYSNFQSLNLGYSSAIAYILFFILLIISYIQLKLFYKEK